MVKVLIVDDDFLVRLFLKGAIDWNKHGYEIVGEAIDGKEALEKIESLKPDIVITDISMPVMNGIEMIKEIRNRKYSCKFIVLSCHDDFVYVKEALKYGAVEYILKNVLEPDILFNLMEDIKKQIEIEQLEKDKHLEMVLLANEGLSFLKQEFIRQLLQGVHIGEVQIAKKVKELNIKFDLDSYVIILLDIDKYKSVISTYGEEDKGLLGFSIINICQEILNDFNMGEVVNISDRQFAMICSLSGNKSDADIYYTINTIVKKIINCTNRYLGFTVTLGVSEPGINQSEMHIQYKQAARALESRFYYGNNKEYYYKDTKPFSNINTNYNEVTKEFKHFIKNGMKQNLQDMINKYIDECKTRMVKPNHMYNFCKEIVTQMDIIGGQYDLTLEDIYGSDCSALEITESIEIIDEMASFIIELSEKLFDLLSLDSSNQNYNSAIKEAIKYINCNYMKDISLSAVANNININDAYLSYLFKRETGVNFVNYIKDLRIEKAVELIQTTNQKIGDIAQNVGISNPKYFSKLFKEKIGVSPNEYKKQ